MSTPRGRGRAMSTHPRGKSPLKMDFKGEKIGFLSNNSKVEVSSDEEGFKGAWFTAKIINHSPPRITPPVKRKDEFLVQYDHLIDSDDSKLPLIEAVHPSYIRPFPPPPSPDQNYEPNDVVDAFHWDGWWKGVVTKVSVLDENKRSYNVVFETPPEEFTFCSKDLRFHLEWINEDWVKPPKQLRMEGLEICKGMQVEVNFDRENLEDAWFPATVVKEFGFNAFVVEYGLNVEIVDSFHIRTLPPKLEVQRFETLEAVDAFCDSCWRKASIAQLLTEGRYVVIFDSEDKREMELSHSDIRPHLLRTNSGWVSLSNREIPTGSKCDEQSPQVEKSSSVKKSAPLRSCSTRKKSIKTILESEDTHAGHSKKLRMENSPERSSSEDSEPIAMLIKSIEKKVKGSARDSDRDLPLDGSDSSNKETNTGPNEQEAGQESGKEESADRKRELDGQVMSRPVPAAVVEGEINTVAADISNQVESMDDDSDSPIRLAPFSRSNAENSSDLPCEEINIQKENNASGQQQDKGEEDDVSEGTAASEMDIEVYLDDPVEDHATEVGASSDTVNDDLAPSTCLTRDDEILNQPCVIDVEASEVAKKKPELPFVKTSPLIWQNVDSQEVFKMLPQNPHFSPLLELNEAVREGYAIANMVNFAGLVDKSSRLKIDKPRSVFDNYLKALADLEKHGFDVKAVVDRINKLLLIKTRDEEAKNQSKGLGSKLVEYDTAKAKLQEEVNAITRTIRKLEEQVAMKVVQMETNDSESSDLRQNVNRFNEVMWKANLDFEKLVCASWKSS